MNKITFRGFTLIELMVTLAVAGILAMMAVPSMTSMIQSNRMATTSNSFVGTLRLARSEAMKRNTVVTVTRTGSTDGHWEDGWVAYISTTLPLGSAPYKKATDTLIRVGKKLSSGITLIGISNANTYISFSANGTRLVPIADPQLSLCDSRGVDFGKNITVSRIGRVTSTDLTGGKCVP